MRQTHHPHEAEAPGPRLAGATEAFNRFVAGLGEEAFLQQPDGKWSAGQDLAHLVKTLRVTGLALSLPGFAMRLLFGTANRASRSLPDLSSRYFAVLDKGVQAPPGFLPGEVPFGRREALLEAHRRLSMSIAARLQGMPAERLHRRILPHPALGKVTLWELGMLTALHTERHLWRLKGKLGIDDAREGTFQNDTHDTA